MLWDLAHRQRPLNEQVIETLQDPKKIRFNFDNYILEIPGTLLQTTESSYQ